ncbi:MAG: YkgJ family cysteine cluster protein [Candidatus Nanoarchaeia archaeon]|nr:YkgJ family cysteine cluster protein [Candidatus Nanoarchaeia archaeon]MDD5054132.1 YkgJ family cysteine cluster protein [Candidatus Nanoarchaeia archaeon]MDD5499267.1 YkgJ family cysteine cluster protein [Candidatus Nanoarchaeia archaeon]
MVHDACNKCLNKMFGAVDCCTSPFTNYPGFLITLSDVNRIIKNTEFDADYFTKIIKVDDEDLKGDSENYFKDLGFNNNFLYLYGKKKCPFKRKDGCIIYEHRPMMCRLFPFWFKKNKNGGFEIIVEWGSSAKDEECLICKKHFGSKDIDFLLSLINETRESMMKIIAEFNEEIKLHKKLKYEIQEKGLKKVLEENF